MIKQFAERKIGIGADMGKSIEGIYKDSLITGEFHFPNDEAAGINVATVSDFLKGHK